MSDRPVWNCPACGTRLGYDPACPYCRRRAGNTVRSSVAKPKETT